MTKIIRKQLPKTVSHNRETYHYAPILSIVAAIYKTPAHLIQQELRKEKKKAVTVIVDKTAFVFTTTARHEEEVKQMELQAD